MNNLNQTNERYDRLEVFIKQCKAAFDTENPQNSVWNNVVIKLRELEDFPKGPYIIERWIYGKE